MVSAQRKARSGPVKTAAAAVPRAPRRPTKRLPKRKVTLTLDSELLEELEAHNESVSAQVNAALRELVEHQRRERALDAVIADWEAEDGPPDENLLSRYHQLLS